MSENQGAPNLKIAAIALFAPVVVIVVIAAVSTLLFGCEAASPAYDPETTCTVDTARAEIVCRDAP